MREAPSAYYPRRAGFLSRLSGRTRAFRPLFRRVRVPRSPSITLRGLLLAIVVPGVGIWLRKPGMVGRLVMATVGILAAVTVFTIGTATSQITFSLLLCLHATGLTWFLEPLLSTRGLPSRAAVSLGILIALCLGLYLPLRSMSEKYLVFPLMKEGQTILVSPGVTPRAIKRGDVIAYRYEGGVSPGHAFIIQDGQDIGAVLALPGDRVEFNEKSFFVNGEAHAREMNMPMQGSMDVPEKHWFVWLAAAKQANVRGTGEIEGLLLKRSLISEEQILGRPMKRWFWRKQAL